MWWNDIKEIRLWMDRLTDRLDRLEDSVSDATKNDRSNVLEKEIDDVKRSIQDLFCSDNEEGTINRIHDKLDMLIVDANRAQDVLIAEKTLDKFEDYMRNVDKFNTMINEFKGCVSLARSAIEDRKQLDKQSDETAKLAKISQEIYKTMHSFIKAGENMENRAHFKINAIYKALCENEEKKSPEKTKTQRKTTKKPSPVP